MLLSVHFARIAFSAVIPITLRIDRVRLTGDSSKNSLLEGLIVFAKCVSVLVDVKVVVVEEGRHCLITSSRGVAIHMLEHGDWSFSADVTISGWIFDVLFYRVRACRYFLCFEFFRSKLQFFAL